MISRDTFVALPRSAKEHILEDFFHAKYPGASLVRRGLQFDVPAGYSVRAAAFLVFELQKELVKKIFVILEEYNTFITSKDLEEIESHVEQLQKSGKFVPERDDLWIVTTEKFAYTTYEHARGKIHLMDIDTLLDGLNKYYDNSRELRDTLRHYGLTRST